MSILSSARGYAAFGISIPRYVRMSFTLDEARALVKARLETRNDRFLEVLERCVFAHPTSPYLPLFRAAGCQLGDVRNLVQSDGLEPALARLRAEGVYFTFEEFKGRKRVDREDLSFVVRSEDFDNPVAPRHFAKGTGGSTGPSTRIWSNLEFRAEGAPGRLLGDAVHGLVGLPTAVWREDAPSSVARLIVGVPFEGVPDRWFVSSVSRSHTKRMEKELANRLVRYAARAGGLKLPQPEPVDDGLPIALWAREMLDSTGRCLIRPNNVSRAVRVAIAALENGIDLDGASMAAGAEPPTPAKISAIRRTGAAWVPHYGFSEGGRVGAGCGNPSHGTDMHFLSDGLALIQHPRRVPGFNFEVDAFNFTSLSTKAPKVLINVESDDYGVIEERSCGCPLEELGYLRHVRDVYSFGKLTGEGVTLVGSDMVRILEEVLPSRFGGTPIDFQLAEEEDERGFTKLCLMIHPRLQIDDESLVVRTVMSELKSGDGASSMAGSIWSRQRTLRVKRMEPIATSRGRVMPLHVSKRS